MKKLARKPEDIEEDDETQLLQGASLDNRPHLLKESSVSHPQPLPLE